MAKMIVILILLCVFIAVLWMGWRMHLLKRDIYSFTDNLEQCLEAMAAGKELSGIEEQEDTLWAKIFEKLRRLQHIWLRKDAENGREKDKIKELISDISHQTKTPIANMKVYLEMLQDEGLEPETRKEFLTKLEGQTKKLAFLLKSMVKMSRLETGVIEIRQEPGVIYDTLGKAVEAVVPLAEKKNLKLYVECEEQLTVNHDKKWTEEAFFNVLDNAVKYTPEGGTIRISAARQEIYTRIGIRDSGKGVAPERQAEIFQRFYREPEVHAQEGIGVGLYLAREIITLQHGYIEVRSEEGKGADFRIYLPND